MATLTYVLLLLSASGMAFGLRPWQTAINKMNQAMENTMETFEQEIERVVMLQQQWQENAAETNSLKQEITILKQHDANQSLEIISLNQILNNQSLDIMKLNNCATTRVAFMAVLTNNNDNPGQITVNNGPVVFNKVVTKTDNSYDPTTGQFTCVIPGLYVFNINAVVYMSFRVDLQLYINSEKITTATAFEQENGMDSGSVTAVVLLKKDDVVKVVATGPSNGVYMNYNMWQENTFAGHLLHADTCLL